MANPIDPVELAERAAIIEYDGNLPRERADALALAQLRTKERHAAERARCACSTCVATGRASVLG